MNSSPWADLEECDKEEPHMLEQPQELAGSARRDHQDQGRLAPNTLSA